MDLGIITVRPDDPFQPNEIKTTVFQGTSVKELVGQAVNAIFETPHITNLNKRIEELKGTTLIALIKTIALIGAVILAFSIAIGAYVLLRFTPIVGLISVLGAVLLLGIFIIMSQLGTGLVAHVHDSLDQLEKLKEELNKEKEELETLSRQMQPLPVENFDKIFKVEEEKRNQVLKVSYDKWNNDDTNIYINEKQWPEFYSLAIWLLSLDINLRKKISNFYMYLKADGINSSLVPNFKQKIIDVYIELKKRDQNNEDVEDPLTIRRWKHEINYQPKEIKYYN